MSPAARAADRVRSIPRPGLPRRSAIVVALLTAAFVGISTTTGTGWPIVLVSLLVGALVAGFVLPPMWLMRVSVSVEVPADVTIGVPYRVRFDTAHGHGVAMNVAALGAGWLQIASGEITLTPSTRGVVDELVVDFWSTAPLGLWTWRRRDTIALTAPMHVAPAIGAVDLVELRQLHGAGQDLPRGVRTYMPGDDRRRVHWMATAREGELMIRELETTAGRRVTIVGGLGVDSRVEERASWLHGAGLAALGMGLEVDLVTLERTGPVSASVTSGRDLGRRLARAVAGGVPSPGPGSPAVDVIDVADHIRRDGSDHIGRSRSPSTAPKARRQAGQRQAGQPQAGQRQAGRRRRGR